MAEELNLKVTGMDCDGCVKAVTRAATGAGTAPISVDLKSGEMGLAGGADAPATPPRAPRSRAGGFGGRALFFFFPVDWGGPPLGGVLLLGRMLAGDLEKVLKDL